MTQAPILLRQAEGSADQGLYWPHATEGLFSCDVSHLDNCSMGDDQRRFSSAGGHLDAVMRELSAHDDDRRGMC